MAKGLIVFVTRSGNCRHLAAMAAQETGFQVHEIEDLVNRKGIFGWLYAGFQATTGAASPIREPEIDLRDVDSIILIYPVWASSVCPPIRTWLKRHHNELINKQFGLIASNLGSPGERVQAAFEREFFPLKAFTVISEKEAEQNKQDLIRTFVSQMA
ncbi:MAG: hypothetical protein LDL24_01125 [Treponema sp.]|nr:hypothetical protein [Treponema sp.]